MNLIDPKYDGVTHINIYSKASTWLGRELSNFSKCELHLPEGKFNSIEGYWYFLGKRHDKLRKLYGPEAKFFGESLPDITTLPEIEFQNKILDAIDQKLNNNPSLLEVFKCSKLPFQHYYYYGSIEKAKVVDAGYKWLLEYFEDYRRFLNETN